MKIVHTIIKMGINNCAVSSNSNSNPTQLILHVAINNPAEINACANILCHIRKITVDKIYVKYAFINNRSAINN